MLNGIRNFYLANQSIFYPFVIVCAVAAILYIMYGLFHILTIMSSILIVIFVIRMIINHHSFTFSGVMEEFKEDVEKIVKKI